jgi:hypothetical protein
VKGKEVVPWCDGMHELKSQGEGLRQMEDGHEKGLQLGTRQYWLSFLEMHQLSW